MRCVKHLSFAAIAALIISPAFAAGVHISGAWFRALPAHLPAGGYFTLHNDTDNMIVLIGATSSACGMVMLHESIHVGGMDRMKMVDHIPVPAHGALTFKPGGYHLMCMNPKPEMKVGARVPVVLEFDDGNKLGAAFAVKNATGK